MLKYYFECQKITEEERPKAHGKKHRGKKI